MNAREIAEKIAEELFVNAAGERADRLVLTVDRLANRDLGGWCRGAVVDRVEAVLLDGLGQRHLEQSGPNDGNMSAQASTPATEGRALALPHEEAV